MWNTKNSLRKNFEQAVAHKGWALGWMWDEKASGQDHLISSLIRKSETVYSVK